MKSGLYACAGASATASAAACAKRFDEPITKLSNVYFGLAPSCGSAVATGRGLAAASAGSGSSATVSETRTSCPSASRVAARTRPRKWLSIHSRVKSFGTTTTNASSLRCAPPAAANHVAWVVSLRVSRKRRETSSQRLSAVRSPTCSNVVLDAPLGSREARAYHPPKEPSEPSPADLLGSNRHRFAGIFPLSTRISTAVENVVGCASAGDSRASCAAVSRAARPRRGVDNQVPEGSSILPLRRARRVRAATVAKAPLHS